MSPTALLEGRAIWFHEFEDSQQQVTAAFASVPLLYDRRSRTWAAIPPTSASASWPSLDWAPRFQINYDALLRQDFIGHTGSAKLKIDF